MFSLLHDVVRREMSGLKGETSSAGFSMLDGEENSEGGGVDVHIGEPKSKAVDVLDGESDWSIDIEVSCIGAPEM